MSVRSLVRVSWLSACAACLIVFSVLAQQATPAVAADALAASPSHQVMVYCFDYPGCCETCQRIVAYTQDAVQTGFAAELKAGKVRMQKTIDFKDPKNKKVVDAYKIDATTVIVTDVRDGKVKQWKSAPEVWKLHPKKDEFFKYIQGEVRAYLEGSVASK